MALPNQTPSDKDALPDRRKATPRNEELAKLIGKEISAVMPTKEESSEQLKVFTAMKGYLEILAGKAEDDDGPAGDEESAFKKLGKFGKVLALVIGSLIGLISAQLKTIALFAKAFTPARLQVQIRAMFRGLTGTVKGFGTSIKAGFSNLLKPLTGLFKSSGGASALGKTPQSLKTFMKGLTVLFKPFVELGKMLKSTVTSVSKSVGIFSRISGFFKSIGSAIARFGSAVGAVAKVASKVFLPLLIIITLFDTIKGALAGFAEGGIIGGIAGAVKGLFNSLIFGPLDMLKGAVAWVLGMFGFDKAAEMLNSFSFASMFTKLIDGIAGFISHIVEFMTNIIMAPIRPIMELFNSLMNMFTNADGEGLFKNISDFFFDLLLMIPKFFLNILDAVAGLFGFDGLREKVYSFFDGIMDNFGIPAFSFKIPIIGKEVSFGGFFPFRDGEQTVEGEAGQPPAGEGTMVSGETPALPAGGGEIDEEGRYVSPQMSKMLELKRQLNAQQFGEDFESLSVADKVKRVKELEESGQLTSPQGVTTVVNNTNVNNQANTQTSSMLFPKQAKNNDDVYGQQQRYAGNF